MRNLVLLFCGIGVLYCISVLCIFETNLGSSLITPTPEDVMSDLMPDVSGRDFAKRLVSPPSVSFVQAEVKHKFMHGFIDAFSDDKAHGWACFPTIDHPVTIRIVDDTRKRTVGEVDANRERAELATAGVCTGAYHGWMFYFEDPWTRGKHDLAFYMVFNFNGTSSTVLMGVKNITTLTVPTDVVAATSKSKFTTRVSWHNFTDEAYELSSNGRVTEVTRTNSNKFIVDHEADSVNFVLVRAKKDTTSSLWTATLKTFPIVHNSEASFFPQFAHSSVASGLRGKKVLVWTHNLHLEGAPICAYQLAVYLKHRAVDVVVQAGGNGTLYNYLNLHGIPVVFGFMVKNHEQYEIIILNTVTAAKVLENRPELWPKSVWWVHEQEPRLFQFFNMNILKGVALAVFPTRGCAETYKEWDTGNFVVIPNGIDLSRRDRIKASRTREGFRKSLKIKPTDFVVTLHGTFADNKGQLRLLEVANKLKEHNIKFLLVGATEGQDDYNKQLLDYIYQNKLSKVMLFYKNPFVDLFYGSTDLHISNTQQTESFGLTLIEAMSFGVPVVAPDLQGMSGIVQHNKTGFLFPPRNNDELTKWILYMKIHPQLAALMGQQGKAYVEKTYSLDFVMRKHEEALTRVFIK